MITEFRKTKFKPYKDERKTSYGSSAFRRICSICGYSEGQHNANDDSCPTKKRVKMYNPEIYKELKKNR